jgi:hypothetical protein
MVIGAEALRAVFVTDVAVIVTTPFVEDGGPGGAVYTLAVPLGV